MPSIAEYEKIIQQQRWDVLNVLNDIFFNQPERDFIAEWENRIRHIWQFNAAEMKRWFLLDYREKNIRVRFGDYDDIPKVFTYFNTLIDYRLELWKSEIPPEANETVIEVSHQTRKLRAIARWTGDIEHKPTVNEVFRSFVRYYKDRPKTEPYHSTSIDEFSGVNAIHLLQYAIEQKIPTGVRIRELRFNLFTPVPPPPPIPKDAVEIAPGKYLNARERHFYLLGKSGQGKSTLMVNLARQDIESGKGVVFIDPHGQEAEKLLKYVPLSRVAETVYFSPTTCPVGLSTLNAATEEEKALVVDDCLVLFKRLSPDSWGPQMEAILQYCLYTLVDVPGATLLDIIRLLTDKQWRRDTILRIDKPAITTFWEHVFETLPRGAANPILTRMALFQLSPFISRTLGSSSTFNFYDHLQRGGIFIANIAGIGEDAANLLGSVLVSQIQLVATRRTKLPEDQRTPCYLYVDEFQNFQSSAFGKIIKESRKFKLYLTVGNQILGDLDPPTYNAVEGVGHSIYFNLTPSDARRIASSLPQFSAEVFADLGQGEVVVKTPKARDSFTATLALPPKPQGNPTQEIIRLTQEKYAPTQRDERPQPIRDDEPGPSGPPSN
jgi:Helicase HerA, central domain